jgi:hypothetical protein
MMRNFIKDISIGRVVQAEGTGKAKTLVDRRHSKGPVCGHEYTKGK